jgi:hypothetical protein
MTESIVFAPFGQNQVFVRSDFHSLARWAEMNELEYRGNAFVYMSFLKDELSFLGILYIAEG